MLLKHSSLPDMCNMSGDTPLHLAARDGYHKVVCQLLKVTTQIDTAGYQGYTPFTWPLQEVIVPSSVRC